MNSKIQQKKGKLKGEKKIGTCSDLIVDVWSLSNVLHEESYGRGDCAVPRNYQTHHLIRDLGLWHKSSGWVSDNNHMRHHILQRCSFSHFSFFLLDHSYKLLSNCISSFLCSIICSTREVQNNGMHTQSNIIEMIHKPSNSLGIVNAQKESTRKRQSYDF